MKGRNILIVEDEAVIREGLTDLFLSEGFNVSACANGSEGVAAAMTRNHDLLILDLMLPDTDGLKVCDQIKSANPSQMIIMLTALGSEDDIIRGFELGADDYLAKPFSLEELLLRVKAVLRRAPQVKEDSQWIYLRDTLKINTAELKGYCLAAGETKIVPFTRREVEMLSYLLRNSSRAVSREELLDAIWNYGRAAVIETRTVDIHIAKLRKKIELNPEEPTIIITVRGEGYRFRP